MTRAALFLVAALGLSGCYTFSGSGLPAGLRTIEIDPIVDRARQPELADRATLALIEAYRKNGLLRKVDAEGQSRLNVTLSNYSHQPQQADLGGNVNRFRVVVGFDAVFTDLRDQSILFEGKNIQGTFDYDPLTLTEIDAREKAMQEAVKVLVDNTVSGW